ncbi:hypothetical protein [Streptococcus sp. M334]|uniref:hypothetical protein n=1 Tax=Streptococcus sp. M334 TaxID=563038 RepID=UPI0001F89DA2|nr:hypothetical protein [Streptococcus sp. M334]EFX57935.1 hypothetical protein HMPREF0851_01985 [Streptococcus sp. M334]
MKARKKPIEVFAVQYSHDIILEEFLKLLRTNEKEPVRYDESDGTIYIEKERGEISLPKGNWVIREDNTDGCFWSINPDIFLQTYNRVKGTLNTFVKRVYEVDFIKMDIDDTKSIIEVLNFLGYFVTTPLEELQRDELVESIKEQGFLEINTLEGVERLFSGEVVVRGVRGEFYPVSYDNFIKVYDILDEGL